MPDDASIEIPLHPFLIGLFEAGRMRDATQEGRDLAAIGETFEAEPQSGAPCRGGPDLVRQRERQTLALERFKGRVVAIAVESIERGQVRCQSLPVTLVGRFAFSTLALLLLPDLAPPVCGED